MPRNTEGVTKDRKDRKDGRNGAHANALAKKNCLTALARELRCSACDGDITGDDKDGCAFEEEGGDGACVMVIMNRDSRDVRDEK